MVNEQAKFFVYWLDTNKHDTAIKWIEQLRQALGMRNQNVVELSGKRAALALWNGFPFICVGNRASIGRFIGHLTGAGRSLTPATGGPSTMRG